MSSRFQPCALVELDILRQLNDRAALSGNENVENILKLRRNYESILHSDLPSNAKLRQLGSVIYALSKEQNKRQRDLNQGGSSARKETNFYRSSSPEEDMSRSASPMERQRNTRRYSIPTPLAKSTPKVHQSSRDSFHSTRTTDPTGTTIRENVAESVSAFDEAEEEEEREMTPSHFSETQLAEMGSALVEPSGQVSGGSGGRGDLEATITETPNRPSFSKVPKFQGDLTGVIRQSTRTKKPTEFLRF